MLHRFYMMQPDSRHIHPQSPSHNGSMYNDNYTIPHTKKVWAIRDVLWLSKYNNAVWRFQGSQSMFQMASNMLEQHHRSTEQDYDHLQKECVGIDRLPGISILQKFTHNLKRAQTCVRRKKEIMQYNASHWQMHLDILKNLDEIAGLNALRNDLMHHDSGHGLLFYDNPTNIDAYLHGFDWTKSVKTVTRPTFKDKQTLWQYIDQYKHELITNNGKICDDASLEFLSEKLKYKMNVSQIKMLIEKYWVTPDDVLDDDEDADDACDDLCDVIGFDLRQLSSKKKKDSEYYIHFIFVSANI